jgi:transcriptional repressor NrdR
VCEARFTTHERFVQTPLMVIKKDGRREPFDLQKLQAKIALACTKRPVSMEQIEQVASRVEQEVRDEAVSEIDSRRIGERVMRHLLKLDRVAYVRFASVYHEFDEPERFAEVLNALSNRRRKTQKTKAPRVAQRKKRKV